MQERITQFLRSEGISPAEFADKIGVQRSSVSHVINGRNHPSASFIQKMLAAFPNLNSRWILLGDGPIFESSVEVIKEPRLFDNLIEPESTKIPNLGEILAREANLKVASQPSVNLNDKKDYPNSGIPKNESNTGSKTTDSSFYSIDNKEIERIVIFFKDKTFEVHTPSK
jgi:transcriptional regulator with XRE-family HTH domain